jgi:hydroxymethylpyrimidine pyrophosphatase-like HAD family hydrolase
MAKRKTLLLCCDIDGTLTMDSEALSAFYEEVKALKLVCNVVLVYNTGRGWDEYHAQLGKNPE